jgi:hypothetical protein
LGWEKEEITEERRLRARLAYRLLQSIKAVHGFTTSTADIDRLRSWLSEVRTLAKEADRAVITDQQIGQILAYAPNDSEDGAWPTKPIRGLIEELAAPEIEKASPLAALTNAVATLKPYTTVGTRKEDSKLNIEVGPNSPPVGLEQAQSCGASPTTGSFTRSLPTVKPSSISCEIESQVRVRCHSP